MAVRILIKIGGPLEVLFNVGWLGNGLLVFLRVGAGSEAHGGGKDCQSEEMSHVLSVEFSTNIVIIQ